MRPARWQWLVAAAALFGFAAWLMARRDAKRPEPASRRVEMPRLMRSEERQRAESRRTLVLPEAAMSSAAEPPTPPRPRDPVLAALPSTLRRGAVVVEANAIRHSPVGQLLVDCFTSGEEGQGLDELRQLTGVDPLEDVDRVALADETLIVSGHFEKARWQQIFPNGGVPIGRDGTLYRPPLPDGGAVDGPLIGVWKNQLVVLARHEDEVRATLDRLEGKGGHGPPPIDESQTYGEIYGVAGAEGIAELVPADQAILAQKLRAAAARVELHVDTSRDVGIVADVTGSAGRDTEDLGKSIGAALALGRVQAQANGERELVELMDLARVVPEQGRFRLEMALPLEVLEKHLRGCVEENQANQRRREQAAQAPRE
jgi:hypothetical protein